MPTVDLALLSLAPLGLLIGAMIGAVGVGDVLLVPLLLRWRVPALTAVGVSQAIQLPVAAFASIGYALYGRIDVPLGIALGVAPPAVPGVGTSADTDPPVLRRLLLHHLDASASERDLRGTIVVAGDAFGMERGSGRKHASRPGQLC